MKTSLAKSALAAFAAGTVLASCYEQPANYAPAAALPAVPMQRADPRATAQPCRTPLYPVPGTYVMLLVSNGRLKGRTYRSGASSYWIEEKLAHRHALAAAEPKPASTSQPTYQYEGTYHLQTLKQSGCMVFITTVNGKPFPGGRVNAKSVGTPRVNGTYKTRTIGEGPMSIVISNLTASGGTGELLLKNGNHTIFDTGSLSLKARTKVP